MARINLGDTIDKIKVMIICGGEGKRLKQITGDKPKAMVNVLGSPLLQRTIELCVSQGFKDIILKCGYGYDIIYNCFKDGFYYGAHIEYIQEKSLLGTAGGLHRYFYKKYPVIILYGDILTNIDLKKLVSFHYKNKSSCTIVVRRSSHPEDSDVVEVDKSNRVKRTIHKPGSDEYGNLCNAALYMISPECFITVPKDGGLYDFGNDMVPDLIRKGFNVFAYNNPKDYIKDIGTPDRYNEGIIEFYKLCSQTGRKRNGQA